MILQSCSIGIGDGTERLDVKSDIHKHQLIPLVAHTSTTSIAIDVPGPTRAHLSIVFCTDAELLLAQPVVVDSVLLHGLGRLQNLSQSCDSCEGECVIA